MLGSLLWFILVITGGSTFDICSLPRASFDTFPSASGDISSKLSIEGALPALVTDGFGIFAPIVDFTTAIHNKKWTKLKSPLISGKFLHCRKSIGEVERGDNVVEVFEKLREKPFCKLMEIYPLPGGGFEGRVCDISSIRCLQITDCDFGERELVASHDEYRSLYSVMGGVQDSRDYTMKDKSLFSREKMIDIFSPVTWEGGMPVVSYVGESNVVTTVNSKKETGRVLKIYETDVTLVLSALSEFWSSSRYTHSPGKRVISPVVQTIPLPTECIFTYGGEKLIWVSTSVGGGGKEFPPQLLFGVDSPGRVEMLRGHTWEVNSKRHTLVKVFMENGLPLGGCHKLNITTGRVTTAKAIGGIRWEEPSDVTCEEGYHFSMIMREENSTHLYLYQGDIEGFHKSPPSEVLFVNGYIDSNSHAILPSGVGKSSEYRQRNAVNFIFNDVLLSRGNVGQPYPLDKKCTVDQITECTTIGDSCDIGGLCGVIPWNLSIALPIHNLLATPEEAHMEENKSEYFSYDSHGKSPTWETDLEYNLKKRTSCMGIHQVSPIDISQVDFKTIGDEIYPTLPVSQYPILPLPCESVSFVSVSGIVNSTSDQSTDTIKDMYSNTTVEYTTIPPEMIPTVTILGGNLNHGSLHKLNGNILALPESTKHVKLKLITRQSFDNLPPFVPIVQDILMVTDSSEYDSDSVQCVFKSYAVSNNTDSNLVLTMGEIENVVKHSSDLTFDKGKVMLLKNRKSASEYEWVTSTFIDMVLVTTSKKCKVDDFYNARITADYMYYRPTMEDYSVHIGNVMSDSPDLISLRLIDNSKNVVITTISTDNFTVSDDSRKMRTTKYTKTHDNIPGGTFKVKKIDDNMIQFGDFMIKTNTHSFNHGLSISNVSCTKDINSLQELNSLKYSYPPSNCLSEVLQGPTSSSNFMVSTTTVDIYRPPSRYDTIDMSLSYVVACLTPREIFLQYQDVRSFYPNLEYTTVSTNQYSICPKQLPLCNKGEITVHMAAGGAKGLEFLRDKMCMDAISPSSALSSAYPHYDFSDMGERCHREKVDGYTRNVPLCDTTVCEPSGFKETSVNYINTLYSNTVEVTGGITIDQENEQLIVNFLLAGYEDLCSDIPRSRGCELRIHETCVSSKSLLVVPYRGGEQQKVDTALTLNELVGKVFKLYDSLGDPIACGTIGERYYNESDQCSPVSDIRAFEFDYGGEGKKHFSVDVERNNDRLTSRVTVDIGIFSLLASQVRISQYIYLNVPGSDTATSTDLNLIGDSVSRVHDCTKKEVSGMTKKRVSSVFCSTHECSGNIKVNVDNTDLETETVVNCFPSTPRGEEDKSSWGSSMTIITICISIIAIVAVSVITMYTYNQHNKIYYVVKGAQAKSTQGGVIGGSGISII